MRFTVLLPGNLGGNVADETRFVPGEFLPPLDDGVDINGFKFDHIATPPELLRRYESGAGTAKRVQYQLPRTG